MSAPSVLISASEKYKDISTYAEEKKINAHHAPMVAYNLHGDAISLPRDMQVGRCMYCHSLESFSQETRVKTG